MVEAGRIARPRQTRVDSALLLLTLGLAILGCTMVLSASAPSAQIKLHDSLFFFKKQVLWASLGFGALAIGAVLAVERLRDFSKWILLAAATLVALTYMPGLGVEKLGASRWLYVGPLSIQPSEIAKLAMVIYLADILARKAERPWNIQDMRQAIFPVLGILAMVNFQPDLGTAVVLAATAFAMYFCSGTHPFLLAGWLSAAAAGAWFKIQHTAYQKERLLAFLDPWGHSRDIGFQITQSLMAIGSGGVLGTGWGQGKQKLFYLPIQHSDFIFSVLAEELGLIGSIVVVLLFLGFAQRGLAIAFGARSLFARLLATGITAYITFQAFLNIGVVTASVPTTGIPLPFLSFGGTALLVTLFGVGLLLSISRRPAAATLAAERD
jgi:cell division protein FtsW